MAYYVGDDKEVAVLLTFIECMVFITEDRAEYQYVGDQILPARSALELVRREMVGMDVARVETALERFDTFIRDHHEAFNAFFAYEHAQVDRAAALDDWVWDTKTGMTPAIPESHWWWAPISVEKSP